MRQSTIILRHNRLQSRRRLLITGNPACATARDAGVPPIAMKPRKHASPRRVAISLDLNWGYKRHLEVYAGCQKYADEAGWDCSINPAAHHMLRRQGGRAAL